MFLCDKFNRYRIDQSLFGEYILPTKPKRAKEQLKECPADGGIWTGLKVARWIEKETGQEKVWNQREWDYLKKSRYSCQKPRSKHKKGDPVEQEKFKQNLPVKVQELRDKFPSSQVAVWFFDEHRVGLKPIIRKVWTPIGERPSALVHHRYEWLYVYGFVEPKTGKTLWYLIPIDLVSTQKPEEPPNGYRENLHQLSIFTQVSGGGQPM